MFFLLFDKFIKDAEIAQDILYALKLDDNDDDLIIVHWLDMSKVI